MYNNAPPPGRACGPALDMLAEACLYALRIIGIEKLAPCAWSGWQLCGRPSKQLRKSLAESLRVFLQVSSPSGLSE